MRRTFSKAGVVGRIRCLLHHCRLRGKVDSRACPKNRLERGPWPRAEPRLWLASTYSANRHSPDTEERILATEIYLSRDCACLASIYKIMNVCHRDRRSKGYIWRSASSARSRSVRRLDLEALSQGHRALQRFCLP